MEQVILTYQIYSWNLKNSGTRSSSKLSKNKVKKYNLFQAKDLELTVDLLNGTLASFQKAIYLTINCKQSELGLFLGLDMELGRSNPLINWHALALGSTPFPKQNKQQIRTIKYFSQLMKAYIIIETLGKN